MPRVAAHQSVQYAQFGSLTFPLVTYTSNATDANQTYTPAVLLGGLIDRTVGAARTDTLPTAAALAEAIGNPQVGTSFEFFVRNISGGAFAVTVAVGAGGTLDSKSTASVAQNNTRTFKLVFTNVGIGTEAYTLYSLGAATT